MRPTDGPAQNIELLEAGEAKLGFVTVGVALQAWNATGVWAGKTPARAMRAIFPMYDTPFQLLAMQEANIRSIADMAGKRIGVGPRGGTSATYFPEFFATLKVAGDIRLRRVGRPRRADECAHHRRAGGRRGRALPVVHRARGEEPRSLRRR